MPTDLILLVAALLISWLVFRWLLTVIKSSASTALLISIIILLLQVMIGISPQELWDEIINLPQTFSDFFQR